MKCNRTSGGRKREDRALQVMWWQAVKAIREVQDVTRIAAVSGINVQSVFRWLADFGDGGQNVLPHKPIPGRPPKVSVEDVRWLAKAARDNTPQQFKFALGLWVMSLIERELGTKSSPALVRWIMKLFGFSA